jgi:hypothetical protein
MRASEHRGDLFDAVGRKHKSGTNPDGSSAPVSERRSEHEQHLLLGRQRPQVVGDQALELVSPATGHAVSTDPRRLCRLPPVAGSTVGGIRREGRAATRCVPSSGTHRRTAEQPEADVAVEANLDSFLDKAWDGKSLGEVLKAPISALKGVSDGDAELLEQAFNVKTIGDLGKNKYFRAALLLTQLSEAGAS